MARSTQLAAVVVLLTLIGAHPKCFAAADWLVDAWRVEDGLPNNIVDAITQTPDGYLWLGTQGGLVRFDGVRFSPMDDPAFKIERVHELYVDRSGRLWVMGESGDVATIHEGQVKSFTSADGVPRDGLQTPAEDEQGRIWFSARANEGCFRFDGARFVNMIPTNSPALGQFQHLAFDTDRTLYGARLGELWKLHPGAPSTLPEEAEPQRMPVLCPSRHGGFWVIARNECFLVRAGKWQPIGKMPYALPAVFDVSANYEDAEGRFWFATQLRPIPVCFTTNGALADVAFTARTNLNCRRLFEDREGNRWWSTGNDGVRRFRPRQLELVSDPVNLPPNAVNAVAADPEEGVWALIGRGLVRITNGAAPRAKLLSYRTPFARSLWIDGDRTVWIGGDRTGLFRISNNRVEQFQDDWNSRALFSAVFRDAKGNLLVGSTEGLSRLGENGLEGVSAGEEPESRQLDFRAFAQGPDGRLYAGLRNAGLMQAAGDKWSRLTNGLPGDDVAALWCDAENSLWIGLTGHGLCRMRDGRIFPFQQTRVGLPRNICGIVEDRQGFLWFASSEGIFRAARRLLNAVADGQAGDAPVRHFDKSDGMISSQCASGWQPVAARSADGRLWFAGARGLYVIDPASLSPGVLPLPVVIEEALVDDRISWKRPLNSVRVTHDVLEVSPHNARLEFRFTSLGLTAPQRNRFRFQLEGLNRDWVEGGTTRVAYFTRVPPGHYKFKVMASDHDGVWSENAGLLAVTVLPFWWQTLWFRLLVGFSGGALLFGIYWRRVRSMEHAQAEQRKFARQLIESQEQERRRISAELHDSLGQSLLVVKNYAVMALKETTPPEKMRDRLREISDATSASIDEVRSIARALRPYQLDRFGLTKTLEDAAELLAKTASVRIETEIDDVDGILSPDAEISVYRVVQEWLNNVVKHAQASTARLFVRKDAGLVRLILEDDGVGFDYAAVMNRSGGETGFGLSNLRERVRLLEGNLKIETAPGKGTRLSVDIPWSK